MREKIIGIFAIVLLIAPVMPVSGASEKNSSISPVPSNSVIKNGNRDLVFNGVIKNCELDITFDRWVLNLPIGIPNKIFAVLFYFYAQDAGTTAEPSNTHLKITGGTKVSGDGDIPIDVTCSWCTFALYGFFGTSSVTPLISLGGEIKGVAKRARFDCGYPT